MTTQAKTPTKRTPKAAQPAASIPQPASVAEAAPSAPVETVVETPVAAPAPTPVAAPADEAPASLFPAFELPKVELPKMDLPKFDIPTFDPSKFELPKFDLAKLGQAEIPAALRDFAEKAVAQAKTGYEKLRAATEEATDALEDTYEATRSGIIAFNSKTIDAAKVNSDATLGHAKDLLGVKTVAEAIELQTSFLRQQYETLSAQAKDLQELATKVAGDASRPAKEALDKTLEAMKKN